MSLTPIKAIDAIDQMPGELASRLRADDYFVDIPVVVVELGDVASTIAGKVAVISEKNGKRGVAVLVLQLIADDDEPEVTFGPLTLKPAFQVIEIPELNKDANGTGKSWRKVARRLHDIIKCCQFVGIVSEMISDKPAIEPIAFSKDTMKLFGGNCVGGQVNFKCYEADDEQLHQCATPQFAPSGGGVPTIIINCATPTATIWFTTDGSFPSPLNQAAQVYTDPLAVP